MLKIVFTITYSGVDMAIQGWDLMGRALQDFHLQKDPGICLKVHSDCSGLETLPVEVFFREGPNLPDLERYALAGAGCHSLILQERGFQVTAADISRDAVKVMAERGLRHTLAVDVRHWRPEERFDTVLMLMNGIGLVGDLFGLKDFLDRAQGLIAPQGQLLLDSTDFTLFPEFMRIWGAVQLKRGRYFGEVEYRMEYQDQVSEAYQWLFVDQQTLSEYSLETGWHCQIIFEEEGQYLTRLTRLEA